VLEYATGPLESNDARHRWIPEDQLHIPALAEFWLILPGARI
jgi:hypothetical protein